jgi:hypothetical protein
VPLIDAEISKYVVGIVPVDRAARQLFPGDAGSGTCVTIGGRYFVATAAHVILDYQSKAFAISAPAMTDFVHRLKGAGLRGGGPRDDEDIGWLELTASHANTLERAFLPLARVRTHCDGNNEALAVAGAPIAYQTRDATPNEKPTLTVGAQWFPVAALGRQEDLNETPELSRRLYLHWPRLVDECDGNVVEQPDAPGMSGGGVWALNIEQPNWSARCAQLVGIEYSWAHRGVPDRFLRAYQIQLWLRMVADDHPELRAEIDPYIVAGGALRRGP